MRLRAIVLLTLAAAVVVFAIVQDRVTLAGAYEYVRLQREALAGRGPAITIDAVMGPAVERSVEQGLFWAGLVLAAGGVAAAVVSRRTHRE